jgi:hypothetical protein
MDFMEAYTATKPPGSDIETGELGPTAEQLKTAGSDRQRAEMLFPCICECVRKGISASNMLDLGNPLEKIPGNPIHVLVNRMLRNDGVLPEIED